MPDCGFRAILTQLELMKWPVEILFPSKKLFSGAGVRN
jgi:hypothetical protein